MCSYHAHFALRQYKYVCCIVLQAYFCEARIDQDVCYAEPEVASLALFILLLILTLVSIFDLACHYLIIPYSPVRRVMRVLFYVFYTLFCWLAIFLVFINATWIFLGTLQVPRKLAQYALAPVLIVGLILKYYAKQRRCEACVCVIYIYIYVCVCVMCVCVSFSSTVPSREGAKHTGVNM